MVGRFPRFRVAALGSLMLWGFLSACSSRPATPRPPAAAPGTVAAPAASQPPTAAAASPTGAAPAAVPPDGKWLVDEEGREYFVTQVPKYEGNYFWLEPEKRVQMRYGIIYDVVAHDASSFSVKVYKVDAGPAPSSAPAEPSEMRRRGTALPMSSAGAPPVQPKKVDRVSFGPFDRGLPTAGQWRNGFRLADMNGDGHLDVVAGPMRKGQRRPTIFLGDGAGGWREWKEARFAPSSYDYGDVAVADFNHDGHQDLALGMHLRGLLVLIGNGAGGFTLWSKGLPLGPTGQTDDGPGGFSTRAVVAADWNSDGWPDLVALGEGPGMAGRAAEGGVVSGSYGLRVFLNHGDGTWTQQVEVGVKGAHFGDDLAVGDLNGDGKLDAALASSVMGSRLILRLGTGEAWSAASVPGLPDVVLVNSIEVLDVDRDGRLDLCLGYQSHEKDTGWRSGVDVYYNLPGLEWRRQELWGEAGREGFFALASGDVDGDGRADLAALSGDGRTLVFLGSRDGSFEWEQTPEVVAEPGRCRGYDVHLDDLDGDGRADLVAAYAGESSAVFDPDRCTHGGAIHAWRSTLARRR